MHWKKYLITLGKRAVKVKNSFGRIRRSRIVVVVVVVRVPAVVTTGNESVWMNDRAPCYEPYSFIQLSFESGQHTVMTEWKRECVCGCVYATWYVCACVCIFFIYLWKNVCMFVCINILNVRIFVWLFLLCVCVLGVRAEDEVGLCISVCLF